MKHEFRIEVELSDQDYLDIFTTAIEGGIDYWFDVSKYHHCFVHDGKTIPDLLGFNAAEYDFDDPHTPYTINRDTIILGISRLAVSGKFPTLCKALIDHEIGDVDAGGADVIVQMGLFNAVQFG